MKQINWVKKILWIVFSIASICFLFFGVFATIICRGESAEVVQVLLIWDGIGIGLVAICIVHFKKAKQAKKDTLLSFDENFDNSTVSDAAELQTISAGKKTIFQKKRILIGAVCCVCIGIIAFASFRHVQNVKLEQQKAEAEAVQEYNRYVDCLNQLYVEAWHESTDAEYVCALVSKVWTDSIYSDYSDKETAVYLTGTTDFNDAIRNVYNDENIKKKLSNIKDQQEFAKYIIQKLQSCPDELSNAYNAALDTYTSSNAFAELALAPSGNLATFNNSKQEKINKYVEDASKFAAVIPAKQSVPYFDEESKAFAEDVKFADVVNQSIDKLPNDIRVEDKSLFDWSFESQAQINGVDGTVSYQAESDAKIVKYIHWKAAKQDKDTVDDFVRKLSLLYGEETESESLDENGHLWSYGGGTGTSGVILNDEEDSLEISWLG